MFLFFFLAVFRPAAGDADADSVRYVPARQLGATLAEEINTAKKSVSVFLYLFALYPNHPDSSEPMRIARALCNATKRGVRVEVVLDKGAYANGEPLEALQEDNRGAYEFLRAGGVDVYFSDTSATLHAKAVVIDSVTVIAGSANFSASALANNVEATLLARSRTVALALLAEFAKLPRIRAVETDTAAAAIAVAFLADTSLFGRMITRGARRAFELYLLLLKRDFARPQGTALDLDYTELAGELGIDTMAPDSYRRQINKTLDKLQADYGLASVSAAFGKNAAAVLKRFPGQTVAVSSGYFLYGWPRRLGFAANAMAIVGLYHSANSPLRPRWSASAAGLSQRYGMSVDFIQTGTVELRRANLLDVEYAGLPGPGGLARRPNIYTPLAFYDPAQLEEKWKELGAHYGQDAVLRARDCVRLVYKDCDWRAVQQFIDLEMKYGKDKVEQAKAIIAQKSEDNPKRTVGYFIRTIINLK
jgi:HKD family nuclease